MSLAHAILGLLTVMPMTGYELKTQAFDSTIAHFWQADQAQIYRTLSVMAEQGWVESKLEIQEGRPNRKVYHITEAGQAELRRWLHTEQPLPTYREAFLVQMFFASELDAQTILEHIDRQREGHAARLAQYESFPLPGLDDPRLDQRHLFWRLTLEMGIAMERAYLEWLETCRRHILSRAGSGA
ncbi:MAG: PadR family transcriptional regulator [Anaerolineae bacterium]|nr:PadR family transcriptional regulator [Anaerolineae bacterium]MDW8171996.1 PadR family transcriptional regulator [Anaerolineae bacterium]